MEMPELKFLNHHTYKELKEIQRLDKIGIQSAIDDCDFLLLQLFSQNTENETAKKARDRLTTKKAYLQYLRLK